jgi:hypothetical protein
MELDPKTIAIAVVSLAGAATGVGGITTAKGTENRLEARVVALETARTYEGEDLKEIKDNQKKILETLNDLKRRRP